MHMKVHDYEMSSLTNGRKLVSDIKVRAEEKDGGKGKEERNPSTIMVFPSSATTSTPPF